MIHADIQRMVLTYCSDETEENNGQMEKVFRSPDKHGNL